MSHSSCGDKNSTFIRVRLDALSIVHTLDRQCAGRCIHDGYKVQALICKTLQRVSLLPLMITHDVNFTKAIHSLMEVILLLKEKETLNLKC